MKQNRTATPRIYRVFTTHRNFAGREIFNVQNITATSALEAEKIAREENPDPIEHSSAMLSDDWEKVRENFQFVPPPELSHLPEVVSWYKECTELTKTLSK